MFTRRCHQRVTHRPPNAATSRGMSQALAALATPALPVADSMAERERLRLEAEAQRRRQGELLLRPGS